MYMPVNNASFPCFYICVIFNVKTYSVNISAILDVENISCSVNRNYKVFCIFELSNQATGDKFI